MFLVIRLIYVLHMFIIPLIKLYHIISPINHTIALYPIYVYTHFFESHQHLFTGENDILLLTQRTPHVGGFLHATICHDMPRLTIHR